MTLDEIRELINLVSETGVAELEVQRGENRVRIQLRSGSESRQTPLYQATGQVAAAPAVQTPAEAPKPAASNNLLIKSPIVGTYYDSASPGSAPFVREGEKVLPGKVLCIIESMKLMNEIESDVAGIVESKLVPNGQPVEYGEALFAIRPV